MALVAPFRETSEMIKYVRSILEENVSSVPLEGVTDVGTISINTVINSVLCDAIDSVSKIAPSSLFSEAYVDVMGKSSGTIGGDRNAKFSEWIELGNGAYMFKPMKFLRCLYTEADNWKRPVTELTPLSSPYVSIARSEINMSAGNEEKPLATEAYAKFGTSPDTVEGATLEVYPKPGNDENITVVYVNRAYIVSARTTPTVEPESINCDSGVYHAACFYAAYLVASIKGYPNADRYKASAMDALGTAVNYTNATAGAEVQK